MKKIITVFFLASFLLNAQQKNKSVWEDFVEAKKNNRIPILPDFSYAGYMYSEVPIPQLNYNVFDVTDYGATPNDKRSDKKAIIKAIAEAEKYGEGIIYFPKGSYYINTEKDNNEIITITSSNIVFRGEHQQNTILYFERDLPPEDPNKLWTCPYAIKVTTRAKDHFVSRIVSDTPRETHTIELENTTGIKKGDWIVIEVKNNSSDLIEYDIAPLTPDPKWTSILEKGVNVNEKHQVASVDGNFISLVSPIHYDIQAKHDWKVYKFAHVSHVGFEHMTFKGNWTKEFIHHKSAQDDGGWSILNLSKAVNSWIKNCTFENVNRAATITSSASCTALDITIDGAIGHSSINTAGSTGILLAKINDKAGMHHAAGVGGGSNTGTVIWRSKHPAHTSFEAHASQPRTTLFDNIEGGFFKGRAGGARFNLPNHGRNLVLWNYNETDEAEENFRFIATDSWYWRIVPPIIVGFHGAGTTFFEDQVQVLESLGTPVSPNSLFEAQLELRLGKLPNWISQIAK